MFSFFSFLFLTFHHITKCTVITFTWRKTKKKHYLWILNFQWWAILTLFTYLLKYWVIWYFHTLGQRHMFFICLFKHLFAGLWTLWLHNYNMWRHCRLQRCVNIFPLSRSKAWITFLSPATSQTHACAAPWCHAWHHHSNSRSVGREPLHLCWSPPGNISLVRLICTGSFPEMARSSMCERVEVNIRVWLTGLRCQR